MSVAVVVPERLDLSPFASAAEILQQVTPDRMKSALMALGAKCGGTPQERAARLFECKVCVDCTQSVTAANSLAAGEKEGPAPPSTQ